MERSMSGSQRSVSDSNSVHIGTTPIDLEVHAQLFSSGWQTALHRAPKVDVESYPLEGSGPGVVSFQLREKLPSVSRFVFAAEHGTLNLAKLPSGKDRKKSGGVNRRPGRDRTKSPTRIKPPAHTVKLEERLWYLL